MPAHRRTSQTNSKLNSLVKILRREQASNCDDSTVVGGLDKFLQRWTSELGPQVGPLPSYGAMSPSHREEWLEKVLASLDASPAKPSRPKPSVTAPPSKLSLDDSVLRLKIINKGNASRFRRLGVEKIRDLLYLFPRRHNDFGSVSTVADLVPGQEQTIVATVWEASEVKLGRRLRSTQAVLGDDTGNVRVTWFNQPYLARTFKPGDWLVISGKVGVFNGRKVFESPEYEALKDQKELVHTGRLVPVYPSVEGLPQRTLRKAVNEALRAGVPQLGDFLADEICHRLGLLSLQSAVRYAHYPPSEADKAAARRRLAFDELFLMQLAVLNHKRLWRQEGAGIPIEVNDDMLTAFTDALPFNFTRAQAKVLKEILADMESDRPMSRLLQGDVGSGKTVVALAALLMAVLNGYQGAFMAPTEILTEQHFLNISRLFSRMGELNSEASQFSVYVDAFSRPVCVGLLTGSQSKRAKEEMYERLVVGEVDIIIGTHALIQQGVDIPRLALAVVDEQHRFGVEQRASLREKGKRPHMLAMSATPIPRSLALTLYGDLDISTIDELPQGREKIRTRWVQPDQRASAYQFLRREVKAKRQAFVICPLIEESEALQTRAAVEEHRRLSEEVFPDLRLGLLHGRMSVGDKQRVMEDFQSGVLDVLVSTPVVEVGIDVPNATVMLIESADRFGLAQLHQFRGRVGRGTHQSYCILMAEDPSNEARERLRVLERTNDGFVVAEEDLNFRGPGDYLGRRQSGLPSLRVALLSDQDILQMARREALRILDSDPNLERDEYRPLREEARRYSIDASGEIS